MIATVAAVTPGGALTWQRPHSLILAAFCLAIAAKLLLFWPPPPALAMRAAAICSLWSPAGAVDGRVRSATPTSLKEAMAAGKRGWVTGCSAAANSALLPLIMGLVCLVPMLCCAAAARLFTGSARTALLAAGLAAIFERSTLTVGEGVARWPVSAAILSGATLVLIIAAQRRSPWLAILAGWLVGMGETLYPPAVPGAALVLLVPACAAAAAASVAGRSLTPATLAAGFLIGLALGRIPLEVVASVDLAAEGNLLKKMRTAADMVAVEYRIAWRFAVASRGAEDVWAAFSAWFIALWRLGGPLLFVVVIYARTLWRLTGLRQQRLMALALLLPVLLLAADAAVGVKTWYSMMPALLPLIVLPCIVWRDL
jgi:hypothetical protein